jgi:hypothetical protein
MPDTRKCEQCGEEFTPRREHARFCSARCRVAWNRQHVGDSPGEQGALGWTITAMRDTTDRLLRARAMDAPHGFAAISEAVWWVTLVDATLVRYHPRNYETTLGGRSARRRETEQTLEGLRYVRNQLGKSVSPADLITPAAVEGTQPAWTWRSLPQPDVSGLGSRAARWELSRYQAYQARLAGRDVTAAFAWCAEFLALAARLAGSEDSPG